MLSQIDYSVFQASRRDALTGFGASTQEQLETDDATKLAAFQLAWAAVCDMRAKQVMTDVPAREAI
jgi:hypothetical protein